VKLPRIGEVFGSNPSASKPYDQAFRDGLRDLGYVDGKNINILARYADGDNARFGRARERIAYTGLAGY
jgi:hypothetical protein